MKNILFLVCIIASSNLLANLKDVLDKDLSNIMEKVVEWRHDIHQNPESVSYTHLRAHET